MVRFLVGAAALAFVSSPLLAVTPVTGNAADGLTALKQLNLIVLGDLSGGQHVQGKAYVGGNLNGTLTVTQGSTNAGQGFVASSYDDLTVGGNAVGFIVDHGIGGTSSTARIGGTAIGMTINGTGNGVTGRVDVGGNVNLQGFNPGASKTVVYGGIKFGDQAQDAPFLTANPAYANATTGIAATLAAKTAQLGADLGALSLKLGQLSALGTITSTTTALNYTGASNGYAVFSMTTGAFQDQNANFDALFANTPVGMTTIINVAGAALVQGGNNNAVGRNQNVIWNFVDAVSLTTKGFHGSILATNAVLTNMSAIEGSVAVKSFVMNGEVHLGTYNGTSGFLTPTAGAVPEPAIWAQMIAGFGIAGIAMRRRRRAVVA